MKKPRIIFAILYASLLALFVAGFPAGQASAGTFSRQASALGLVGWWKFDEGTSTVAHDYSGNGLNGTLVNASAPATATSGWGAGKRGGSIAFDGTNDHVVIAHNAILKPASEITFSAWVKPDVGSLNAYREIYRKEDGNNRHLFSFQQSGVCGAGSGTGGCLSFGLFAGASYSEFDVPIAASDYEGRWSLLTMTYDGSNRRFYKDGVLASSTPTTGAISTLGSSSGYIGSMNGTSEFFKGSIDDFRIYSRALSASEVAGLYGSGSVKRKSVSADGLFLSWTFDEGTSTLAHDFSGNGRNGSVVSSLWTEGRRGGALNLSGASNYVVASSTLSEIGAGSATYAVWFKGNLDGTAWQRMLNTGCSGYSNGMFIANNIQSGKVSFASCSGFSIGSSFVPTSVASYFDGAWHHVVNVVDRSSGLFRMYVDGINVPIAKNAAGECGTISGDTLSMDISACTSATATGSAFRAGSNSTAGEQFNGMVDDLRIYSRALSGAEALALYREGKTVLQGSQENQVSNGLVGYWSFNGKDVRWTSPTAGIAYDRSGQGNNGTFIGMSSSASPVAGKTGQALSFNGISSYVSAAKPASLTSTVSVCVWAKWMSVGTGQGTIQVLVDNNHAGVPNRGFALQDRPDLGKALTFTTSPGVGAGGVASTFQVGDGTWRHICGTNDGSMSRLYIDGALDNSLAETSNANYQPTVSFGRWLGGNRYLNGSMDEIRLYNRAISASEVKQLYDLGR